jgi:hypothetical protein
MFYNYTIFRLMRCLKRADVYLEVRKRRGHIFFE